MNTIYLDIFSGISGDMFLGAMLDLGVDFSALEQSLAALDLEGYHVHAGRARRGSIEGVKFDVHLAAAAPGHPDSHPSATAPPPSHHHRHHGHPHAHPHRTFASIRSLIEASPLPDWVKSRSVAVFGRIAEAEGRIHGQPAEQVAFHEVGAVDSVVDIVGACVALDLLGRPRLLSGPVIDGTGWIQSAHGPLPLPAPATLAILGARGAAITQCDEPAELVTPTGAALLAEFAESFGPMRNLAASRIGYGLGSRENRTRPNVLRAVLSETTATAHDWETDTVAVCEANVDDLTGELLGHFIEVALAAGALEVAHTPVTMKKSRPGILLTLLCPAAEAEKFLELILRETGSLGVRYYQAERRKLRRQFGAIDTLYGTVRVKSGLLDGQVIVTKPEYDSCRQVSQQAGVPLRDVDAAARRIPPGPVPG
ncbi:MAG: nickel pincer cofactor biosynthesis protein LarC [Verrucomicrobia bacterium]|nr:nickel pincer cofactor biosynthesis protein LarC [Verrucomicrobiota bacterium]